MVHNEERTYVRGCPRPFWPNKTNWDILRSSLSCTFSPAPRTRTRELPTSVLGRGLKKPYALQVRKLLQSKSPSSLRMNDWMFAIFDSKICKCNIQGSEFLSGGLRRQCLQEARTWSQECLRLAANFVSKQSYDHHLIMTISWPNWLTWFDVV